MVLGESLKNVMSPRDVDNEAILNAASANSKGRDVSLDVIKVISIYFVMIIHVDAYSFYTFSKNWLPTIIVDSFARTAMPMFFMITGALLLNKEHSVRSIIKRIRRVLVPLLVWSVIYIEYNLTWAPNPKQSIAHFATEILAGPVMYHLWYIYALIGLYIFMPVYSAFYQKCSRRVIVFTLIAWYIGCLLVPTLTTITDIKVGIGFDLPLFSGYLILGAFCYDAIVARNKNASYFEVASLLSVWLVTVIATAYFTYALSKHLGSPNSTFLDPRSPTAALCGAFLFPAICLLLHTGRKIPPKVYPIINHFSRTCFGVYLMHVLVLLFAQSKGVNSVMITPWVAIPLLSLALLVGCSIIVRGLQFIPAIRDIVPK